MAAITFVGKGQVEPNHLSAQRNGQIYAQLPMAMDELQNGQIAKYDYAAGKVNYTGEGEWMLVYNEVQLYGKKYNETEADYSMKKDDFAGGVATPRLFKTAVGDIFTTNCFSSFDDTHKYVIPDASTGFLKSAASASGDFVWQVAKVYTMPDGTPGVKIQRIK